METKRIRIKRSSLEEGCAPEYANNHLAVDIDFANPLYDVKEISVCVYNFKLQFMGNCTSEIRPNSRKVRFHFDVFTAKTWMAEDYLILVYKNGRPAWRAELFLPYDDERAARGHLEALDYHSPEMFFASELCMKDWWPKLVEMVLSRSVMEELIEHFQQMHQARKMGWASSYSAYFVTAVNASESEEFSFDILPRVLEDTSNRKPCCMRLRDLVTGELDWYQWIANVRRNSVVLMDISHYQCNDSNQNVLKHIFDFLEQKSPVRRSVIFYGDETSMENICSFCKVFREAKTKENSFVLHMHIPYLYDNEEQEPDKEESEFDNDSFDAMLDDFVDNLFGGSLEDGEGDADDDKKEDAPSEEDEVTDIKDDEESVQEEDAEACLEQMVGLTCVKQEISLATTMAQFYLKRKKLGFDDEHDNRNHMLFLGAPGTGKTTVAKLIGKMYHHMGLLSSGHTVVTDRSKLIGEYIGLTEKNTKEIIEKARGGVLFIDEAYTLMSQDQDSRDFGKEVLNCLLTLLSEPNPDMIVIMAGYDDKMKKVLQYNQGLKDRFPLVFHFQNYTAEELMQIATGLCSQRGFEMSDAAKARFFQIIEQELSLKDPSFGNGRWVHNLLEHGVIKCMALRVMSQPETCEDSKRLFSCIEEEDVILAEEHFLSEHSVKPEPPRKIGFRA